MLLILIIDCMFVYALRECVRVYCFYCVACIYTGWPKKLAHFFVQLNFVKYRQIFKIISC